MKAILFFATTISILFCDITTGKVVDTSGAPIKGAIIKYQNSYTFTQEDGTFRLKDSGPGLVTISHIGFETLSLKRDSYMRITMNPKVIIGKDVQLISQIGNTTIKEINSSITLIEKEDIKSFETEHFETQLNDISNLNWSSGSSRPRYFQIRGIGERSHYTGEGPPNFSVGFNVDNIDLSGIGMSAMMFDLSQIEIVKGSQSSIFGSNSLAGSINLKSSSPTPFWSASVFSAHGNDKNQRLGIVVNSPLSRKILLRTGVFHSYANGFRENVYYKKTDTNSKQESMIRSKLSWSITSNFNLQMTFMDVDLDNKYDAWSPDNNEDLITYTDRQGFDNQKLSAISLESSYLFKNGHKVLTIISKSNSNMEHSYDGDWGNNSFWENEPYNFDSYYYGFYSPYDYFDSSDKKRETLSNEIRLISPDRGSKKFKYVFGLYQKSLTEEDSMNGWIFGGEADQFSGQFDILNLALYSKFDFLLGKQFGFDLSTRIESASLSYEGKSLKDFDYDGVFDTTYNTSVENRDELLPSMKGAIYYDIAPNRRIYTSISTGYKAGGVNQNPRVSSENRRYNSETNINYEVGYKLFKKNRSLQSTIFFMQRQDLQVNVSAQQDPGNPNSFYFFTSNASSGSNYGLELESVNLFFNNRMKLTTSIGYLKTWVDEYEFYTSETDKETRGDREQAQAPNLSGAIGIDFSPNNALTIGVKSSYKGSYFYSDSYDLKTDPYQLINLSLNYKFNSGLISAFVNNITDIRYPIRGFYFGLVPPNYEDELYVQWGSPIHYGFSIRYDI